MTKLERRSLSLTPEQWAALERRARQRGSLAPTGPNAGRPSWRTYVKEIANEIILNDSFQLTPAERRAKAKRSKEIEAEYRAMAEAEERKKANDRTK